MSRTAKLQTSWNSRTVSWHDHVQSSAAFETIRAALLAEVAPSRALRVVDLGAGTGFLTLSLAPEVGQILAVDLSPKMLTALSVEAANRDLGNVECRVVDLMSLDLAPASVDLIVSSYALHHLRHRDKEELLRRARRWLVPGGRIIVADMMFGRGNSSRDRQILRLKTVALLRKGPAGAWRVGKNIVRFGLGIGADRPASPEFWTAAMKAAGFVEVRYQPVVAEAGIVTAWHKAAPATL